METNQTLYGILGIFTVWGLGVAFFGARMPGFNHRMLRDLPEVERHQRLRRARRAGVLLAILSVTVAVGLGTVTSYVKRHHARTSASASAPGERDVVEFRQP